jgi:Fic family protein
MSALEKFLHNDPVKTSPVIKAGLAHPQFETIHPFLDGNGRLGDC